MRLGGQEKPTPDNVEKTAEPADAEFGWPVDFPLAAITPSPIVTKMGTLGIEGKHAYRLYPTFYKELEDKGYILSHSTPPIPLEALVEHNPNILDLLRRQRVMRFPTLETLTKEELDAWSSQPDRFNIKRSDAYTMILNEKGFPGEPQADLTKPEITGTADINVNTFLALLLANHPEIRAQFPTPIELYTFAKKNGLNIDFHALKNGFIELFESDIQTQLIKLDALNKQQLKDMYKRVAIWIAELQAIKIKMIFSNVARIESKLGVFPYPTERTNKRNPNLAALPYILASQILFMRSLPDIIPPRKFYSLETLSYNIRRTNEFIQAVLTRKIEEAQTDYLRAVDEDQTLVEQRRAAIFQTIERIRAICEQIAKVQIDIYEHYRENAYLLNKTRTTTSPPPLRDRIAVSYSKLFTAVFGTEPSDLSSFLEQLDQLNLVIEEELDEETDTDLDES